MNEIVVFLAGVPASGKSHFGRWVEQRHGFLHIDAEKDERLKTLGLESAWNGCFSTGGVEPFVSDLRKTGRPVIFNWGFPVSWLRIVQGLKQHGLVPWWFDADAARARREFVDHHGEEKVFLFDRQMEGITSYWPSIEDVLRPNILKTLEADGSRMKGEEIFRVMFPSRR